MLRFFFKQERCKDEKLQSKYACADQPSPPGCRTDGAINRCMSSVSATSGPDTELQVPDEILQKIGIKTSFSKDVPKLSSVYVLVWVCFLPIYSGHQDFFKNNQNTPRPSVRCEYWMEGIIVYYYYCSTVLQGCTLLVKSNVE